MCGTFFSSLDDDTEFLQVKFKILGGGLEWMIFWGPLRSLTFCDSVKLDAEWEQFCLERSGV